MRATLHDLRDRPVFICGHPKAGTSLMRNLLDSHPQLVVYPEESSFFRRYLPAARGQDLETQLKLAEEKLVHIFEWNLSNPPAHQNGFPDRDYSAIDHAKVVAEMRALAGQLGVRHPGDLLSAAVLAYGEVSGHTGEDMRWWVEKTPYNERFAKTIFGWWPEARCIHVVRDPRDNFCSYIRKHATWTAEFFADNWSNSARLGLSNQERYGKERYWLLKYEDLVQQPEETIDELCRFLGIAAEPILSIPTRGGVAWEGNSMFTDSFRQISAAPIGRWQTELPPADAAVIEAMAGRWMRPLGYTRGTPQTLKTFGRVTTWRARQTLYRLLRPQQVKNDLWMAGE